MTSANAFSVLDRRRVIGCSILPFSLDRQWGKAYVCLGKEKRVANWYGSEKWSDFGGAPKRTESANHKGARTFKGSARHGPKESPEACAAREFHEETLGMLKLWKTEECPRQSWRPIAKALENRRYAYKITIFLTDELSYVTFVKQVPWQPEVPKLFKKMREKLYCIMNMETSTQEAQAIAGSHPAVTILSANGGTERKLKVNKDFLEKSQIRWWSVPQLTRASVHSKGALTQKSNKMEHLRSTFKKRSVILLREFPSARCTIDSGASFSPIDCCTYNSTFNAPLNAPCATSFPLDLKSKLKRVRNKGT